MTRIPRDYWWAFVLLIVWAAAGVTYYRKPSGRQVPLIQETVQYMPRETIVRVVEDDPRSIVAVTITRRNGEREGLYLPPGPSTRPGG